jgi:hypothetical protein
MEINLVKLAKATNSLYQKSDIVEINICDNNTMVARKGGVCYYFSYDKLQSILNINPRDYKNEDMKYFVLSRHLCNQLEASLGKKVYEDINSEKSNGDLI